MQREAGWLFALLMCFTFMWLSAQLIHGRGTSVGQSTQTNSGWVTALCLLTMLWLTSPQHTLGVHSSTYIHNTPEYILVYHTDGKGLLRQSFWHIIAQVHTLLEKFTQLPAVDSARLWWCSFKNVCGKQSITFAWVWKVHFYMHMDDIPDVRTPLIISRLLTSSTSRKAKRSEYCCWLHKLLFD